MTKKQLSAEAGKQNTGVICLYAAVQTPKIKDTIPGHALCVARLDSIEPFKKEHLEGACMGDMPEGKCYAWHLTDIRAIYPFPVKGKLNFFNVDDSLIKIVDDEGKIRRRNTSVVRSIFCAASL